ncbi:MAG TPA: glycoside hydrolase family 2 TIM barrel-domain containing protein, partial [Pyrinomonadaceae bacterium]
MSQLKGKRRVDACGVRPARGFVVGLALCVFLLAAFQASAQTVSLERGWQFLADRDGTLKEENLGNAAGWRDVRVGLSWNAQFAELRDYMGVAWYRTTFDAPRLRAGQGRVLVRFGAVDYFCEVYVNGRRVGEHEGGYTPFSFDVTEALRPGTNRLSVRVIDPPMDEKENRARFPRMMYNEIPHGKQNWYVQTGGIWQPVMLETRPRIYIERLHVTPQVSGEVLMEIELASGHDLLAMFNQGLRVTIRDPRGRVEFTQSLRARDGRRQVFRGRVKAPELWSLKNPALYSVEAELQGEPPQVVRERFGFRSFEARDGKFYLNGEPFYLIGALDQDFYPETIYTPPSEEYVRDQMLKSRRLGLNLLRCHIKVCDPTYLKVADEVGMLVWYEIPSWNDFNHFTPRAAERGERIFAEQVARDWNHPSIVIQSIINESWGADLKQAEQRRWLRAAFGRAKQLTAPLGRLIVDNSACCENF